ncbi:MAG: sulfate permease, SulP family [Patescibacteria group bacterium]|nr:sulfate permease, SulP family [Patescibacteria group bacterium]
MHVFENLKNNWKSGLTVALVSIPLSISLAVASGASPVDGIITAIWAGLFASIFGGSNFNIVGLTGALSGILATYAIIHGPGQLSIIAVIAGIFILLAYFLKLERYLVFVPASAIHGFTLGVAIIIALNQLNFATGIVNPVKHERLFDNVAETFRHVGQSDPMTLLVFVAFLGLLFAFLKYIPRVPAVIALTPFGILLGYASSIQAIPIQLQTLQMKFGELSMTLFQAEHWTFNQGMLLPAFAVALIAILETMLSAKIADAMTHAKHDKRKEMLGLGLANMVSGACGGLPATAALARTSLNVRSGSTSKFSGTISAVGITLISFLFFGAFKFIPLAVIAAILVFTAVRMVEVAHFRRMFNFDHKEFILSLVVAGITFYVDPIFGILFGTAAALILFVDKLTRGQFELLVNDKNKKSVIQLFEDESVHKLGESQTLVYSIKGQLAYFNAAAHVHRFESELNNFENIIIRLRELYFIDIDGIEALDEIIEINKSKGKRVFVTGVSPLIERDLLESKEYQLLCREHKTFKKTSQVLSELGYNL